MKFKVYIDHSGRDCDGSIPWTSREEDLDEEGLKALLGQMALTHTTFHKEANGRTIEYIFGRHNGEGFETTSISHWDPEAEPTPAYDSDSESGAHLFVMGGS